MGSDKTLILLDECHRYRYGNNYMSKSRDWTVYIIQAESGKLYTGITTDLEKRFAAHQSGNAGARFFRTSSPEKIVYRESHTNRSSATKREIAIKKMSRKQKLKLILESTEAKYPNASPDLDFSPDSDLE